MSGYMFVIGSCCCCGTVMTFNPMKVPSITIEGTREPVCAECIVAANKERAKRGVALLADPLPGAYEAAPDYELPDEP